MSAFTARLRAQIRGPVISCESSSTASKSLGEACAGGLFAVAQCGIKNIYFIGHGCVSPEIVCVSLDTKNPLTGVGAGSGQVIR
jgi:hypothetical protein